MSPNLTIIGLNFAPEPTGNAPYTTSVASHLAEAGWTVKVITGYPHYPQWKVYEGYSGLWRRESVDGVDVLRLRHYVPRRPGLVNRLLMEFDFGLRSAVVGWSHPDVVLLVSPALFSAGIAAVAAKLRHPGARTAIWVQDLYGRGFEESRAFAWALAAPVRRVEARILSRVDRAVVIHDRFRDVVCRHLGLAPEHVQVIRNWSHIDRPPAADRDLIRGRFGWLEDDIVVLHAGNMGLKQYLDNVIDAATIAGRRGSRVRFVLLGTGNQRARLECLGARVPRLQFIDPLPDELYASALVAADILLVNEMPGVREMSVPSKLTSYFASGRPILAASEGESATASELTASGAGAVVRSGDPLALVEAAERLGSDPRVASRFGRCGPRFARNHLSTEAAVQQWDTVLRSLLDQ